MSYLKKLLNNCDETCMLALRGKEEPLTFRQRLEVKIHLRFCKCCQNFTKQSDMIDETMKEYFRSIDTAPPVKAPEALKAKIKDVLK